ncbi:Flagellar regulatory protein FleQ [Chitinispirillum alkaliphilum]|nr:Flagellar regulatory protein FleQ [Chitinispirillum alkaliphilum]
MKKILIVDDEQSIRIMLVDHLENNYHVRDAQSAREALEILKNEHYDLVISDINMPGMSGPLLLKEVKQQYPNTKTALITAYDIDNYVKIAWECSVSNIIPKTVPFNFYELDSMVDALLTGEIFGIARYLQPDGITMREFCITSSVEGREVREQITTLFEREFGSSGDMLLLLDEIITNAVYHASRYDDGQEKYSNLEDVNLEPHEYVYVCCGYDSEKYGVSVVDNQGKLSKERVLQKVERQISGEGVLDYSGRGIHMSRLFSDRMIINIDPDTKTEVILLNYFSNKYRGYKPLYINEL